MNFSPHINYLSSRISFLLKRLYSLNIYLPSAVKRKVATAILMPHILYCMEIFSSAGRVPLHKYMLIFNRIVRYIFNLKKRDHISQPAFDFLGSSFENFICIRVLLFFYKSIINGYPMYIVDMFNFTRSVRSRQIRPPIRHLSVFEKAFQCRVASMWNALPRELREFTFSVVVFKSKLIEFAKTHLLDSSHTH